jgi:putative Mg2+ transporter-C (MgtC) family protein
MDDLINELKNGIPTAVEIERVIFRMIVAALLGAVIGYQREVAGKPAGLRTHMLVSLGTALFVLVALEADFEKADVSRIIQGLAAGIGFLGAGAILKITEEHRITGLTTAAGIWMTAAVGVAVGLGRWGSAALSVLLTWMILSILGRFESNHEKNELRTSHEKKSREPSQE